MIHVGVYRSVRTAYMGLFWGGIPLLIGETNLGIFNQL